MDVTLPFSTDRALRVFWHSETRALVLAERGDHKYVVWNYDGPRACCFSGRYYDNLKDALRTFRALVNEQL